MSLQRTTCKGCGAPIVWVGMGVTHRPVDEAPVDTYPGCEGLVIDPHTKAIRWVSDLPKPPPRANMLHYCPRRRRRKET